MKKLLLTTATVALMGSVAFAQDAVTNAANILQNSVDIETNKNLIDTMDSRIDSVDQRLQSLNQDYPQRNEVDGKIEQVANNVGLKPHPASGHGWVYHKNENAEYISEAENLVDADNKLDAALKEAVQNGAAANDEHDRRLDAAEGRLDTVEPKVTTLEGEMDAVEGRVTTNETKISNNISRMNNLEDIVVDGNINLFNKVESEIGLTVDRDTDPDNWDIRYDANTDANYIDDAENLVDADNKLDAAIAKEAEVNDQQRERLKNQSERISKERQDRMAAVTDERQKRQAADAELGNRIDSNTARVETNETNIANNTTTISNNTSRITTNETNISKNTTAISSNKAAINQNTAEISNLQDKVEEMEAGMAGLAALYGIPDMERGVGVGVGSYNGHVAVAVGYQDEIAEGVHVKVGISIDEHGNNAVSGGIGWEF